jgi:hypothetical protein
MTAKGQIRGPNHFIDPPVIGPGERTGVRIHKARPITERDKYTRIAKALVEHPEQWCKTTIYPFKQGHDMVKVAEASVRRLGRTGQKGGMTLIANYIKDQFGKGVFDLYKVEAELDQQPDGSLEVWVRWTERSAA